MAVKSVVTMAVAALVESVILGMFAHLGSAQTPPASPIVRAKSVGMMAAVACAEPVRRGPKLAPVGNVLRYRTTACPSAGDWNAATTVAAESAEIVLSEKPAFSGCVNAPRARPVPCSFPRVNPVVFVAFNRCNPPAWKAVCGVTGK